MRAPVSYIHRKTKQVENEAIYGESSLRWIYESPLGRAALHTLVKRAFFSKIYGWMMDRPSSREKIALFLERYGINQEELADKASDFEHFNAFFTRALRPGARPLAGGADVAVLPADGRHAVIADLSRESEFLLKGKRFDLASFTGNNELAARFQGGSLLVSRLCPLDYHRYHFPCAGLPGPSRPLNGPFYSVNPIALNVRPSLLWENKRWLCEFKTEHFGTVLLAEIGATCVGSVVTLHPAGYPARKGDEKGWFRFGGSSVALVFERGRIRFDDDLLENSGRGYETYALMGESLGRAI